RVEPSRLTRLSGLLPAIVRLSPTLVLLDLDLGEAGDGTEVIGPLAQSGVVVAVVTSSLDEARHGECLFLGARSVMAKTSSLEDILTAIGRLDDRASAKSVRARCAGV